MMNKTLKSPPQPAQTRDGRNPARNKKFKAAGYILILFFLVGILILPYFVFAETAALSKLKSVGDAGGYDISGDETQFASILGTIVSAFLSLLGIIFIILIIYAGHKWMTASGNEENITKAKETLWRAVIGLIIVVGAYAIWKFVFWRLFYGLS